MMDINLSLVGLKGDVLRQLSEAGGLKPEDKTWIMAKVEQYPAEIIRMDAMGASYCGLFTATVTIRKAQ